MICDGAAGGGSDDFYGVPDPAHGNAAPTKRGRRLALTSGGWRRRVLATFAGGGEVHASGCEVERHREEVEREEEEARERRHGSWLGRWG